MPEQNIGLLILEGYYKELNSDKEEFKLFPIGWVTDFTDEAKIKMLDEAISKGILLIETKAYSENVEGIKFTK